MTHDPNVYGYVNGKPVFSRDEFIFERRKRGPIEDDAELIAFAEKATSGWHSSGWRHIVNAAIALIGAGVSVFLIPWLKSQTTEAQRKELTAWVKIGVAAAEQLYKGAGRGEEKKQYVIDFLKQKGFKVDEESVINAIEAAVKQLNTEGLTIE